MAINSSPSIPTFASTNIFNVGNYSTNLIEVEPKTSNYTNNLSPSSPPKPLLICSPTETGEFPVLLLIHGLFLRNSFYSQVIQHIASHGFIVVAPQLYKMTGLNAHKEIDIMAEITNWLSEGLVHFVPPNVNPNLEKLVLAGHCRGGKVAFALALSKPSPISLKFSALIGIDPVDGIVERKQTAPPILTYTPRSFNLDGLPVLVIGSGLGKVRRYALFPSRAPKGVNHEDFYNECRKPAYYFVGKDYGHLDLLDDDTGGCLSEGTLWVRKDGESREPTRRFVGGIVIAFLKAYLEGNSRDLIDLRGGHHEMLPIPLQRVEFRV